MASVPEIAVPRKPSAFGRKAPQGGNLESKTALQNDACLFVAMYSYDPATMSPNPGAVNDELPFREGQVIRVYGECDEDGFYFGECNGKRGLVPSNMVRAVRKNEVPNAKFSGQQHMRRGSVTASEKPISPGQIQAPRTSAQSRSQKWRLENKEGGSLNNAEGSFTAHHREPRTSERRPASSHPSRNKNTYASQGPKPRGPEQIGPTFGEQLSSDGHEITAIKRPPFYRPPDDEPVGSFWQAKSTSQHKMRRKRLMEALFDYNPQIYSPNVDVQTELPFCAGDRLLVFGEMDEDGFYFGQLENGQRGLVPSNFLREVKYWKGSREDEGEWKNEEEGESDDDVDMKQAEDIRHGVQDLSGCESDSTVNGRVSGAYTSQSRNQQRYRAAALTGQTPYTLGYRSPLPVPQGKLKQRRQEPPTGIEAVRQSAVQKKTSSRPRVTQQRGNSSQMNEGRRLEEESMIALTVPPASDWGGSPVQNNERNSPAQRANAGRPNQIQESADIRKSDESDKESVIIMDINSSKNRKPSRKTSLSRMSSNETSEVATSRRRSVFRSPFKKDPGHS
ncbi:hypothetical protein AAHC03_05146 [Spirometra sp. Aus1]